MAMNNNIYITIINCVIIILTDLLIE